VSNQLTRKDQSTILKRLFSYLKPHKKLLATATFFLALSVGAQVISPILVKIFLDNHVTQLNFETKPIMMLLIIFFVVETIGVIMTYLQHYQFNVIALNVIKQLRIDVFEKIGKLGMRYFDRVPAGAIVSRTTNDTEAIKELFVNVLISFIQALFLIVGIYIAMFFLNPVLALFTIFILPLVFLIVVLYRKFSSVVYMQMREKLSELNAKLSETLSGMSVVQAFRQEKRLREEFNEINQQHLQASMRNINLNSYLLRPMISLIYLVAIIVILAYFGFTSFNSYVEVGLVYAFVTYINRFFEPINQMMEQLATFQQAIVAGKRVFELLDEEEMEPQQLEKDYQIQKGSLEFKNLSFSYDEKQDVLKNISFTVNPGETLALVGHTGSGKSSIINLLMRFYEFDRGEILIDGVSIKDYSQQELRKKIGLVLQDPFLFYGTIESNIKLFGDISTEEALAAVDFVNADFVHNLPNSLQEKVTERGSTYSSGQRQLIAFARTMAVDPKILVLDEATASIDTETEVAIQKSLNKMRKGRTTIAIAHRLSTIQDAEHILVLHQGEIVEYGTHQQLLAKQGLYHKMYLLQNGITA